MDILSARNLTKQFGSFTAVTGVSFTVAEGEMYALIGPNGAGKTTLLKMLVGLLHPTSGSADICGHDISKSPLAAKRQFAYISDDPSAYDYLSGREFLTFTGRLRGMSAGGIQTRIKELLPVFPVSDVINKPMNQYSRGNRQKVAFLASLLSEPKLLVIDEPVVGMDDASIKIMGATLKAYVKKGNAVLIVTHILDFAKTYADRAGIMKSGSIVRELAVTRTSALDKLL